MKMLVVFQKSMRLRHIGHLDLMRAMQRALRRSDLPLCYSQGFNPHMLVTFAAPLSVGMAGEREMMEVPLPHPCAPDVFLAQLREALPPDLPCVSARLVDDTHAAPMAQLCAATYVAVPEEETSIFDSIPAFLAQNAIPAIRKTKTGDKPCDIRPMIYDLSQVNGSLRMTLALCEAATCKPDLLLASLCAFAGIERPRMMITRTQLYGKKDGILTPLEQL